MFGVHTLFSLTGVTVKVVRAGMDRRKESDWGSG